MKAFVTGAGGFIGSNLVDRLLQLGWEVVGYDNWSTGQPKFLNKAHVSKAFTFFEGDILDTMKLMSAMFGSDIVFHLSANADVRHGVDHTRKDLEQNINGTWSVLEAMRIAKVNKIVFSSTGSIYGESKIIPTPENVSIPIQTSLYGASKMASEGLIQAFSEAFGIQAWIFRFVSVTGERYSHGHIFDFYKQLKAHPDYLDVLGNGTQNKSYIYVQDLIDGVLRALSFNDRVNIFNLGTEQTCLVKDSIGIICHQLGLNPIINYGLGDRGWIGDNPTILLDITKLKAMGWYPKYSIEQGIIKTVSYLEGSEWLLEEK